MTRGKIITSDYDPSYHDRQFKEPYQSTIKFCDWLITLGKISHDKTSKICDLGCGKGANLYYFSKKFPNSEFIGLDINEKLINEGNTALSSLSTLNVKLTQGDLYNARSIFKAGEFDGIVSLQTLSWLPNFEEPLDAMISLAPQWIAVSSLFYDGPVEAKTLITQHDIDNLGNKKAFVQHYNTYSLPMVKDYFHDNGYPIFNILRFEIAIDLPMSPAAKMQTYTEKTMDGRRLQISGPVLMSWYFICASKE
nr:methyltransferase domain-containing protein [Cytophagales bacterium]